MTTAPPKLRSDLTVSRQQAADGPLFVLKDPDSGQYFRFGESEHFIAAQLDGETPLDVVRHRTEEHFDASLSAEALDAFLKSLDKRGLLETSERKKKDTRPIRGGLLYLRVPLFDPDRLLGRLVRRAGPFFTPQFVLFSAVTIALAAVVVWANGAQVLQEIGALIRLSAVPPLLAVAFAVASAHEFAHGVTCKRFGGEVHEMGFMLIYFQPGFYCNVGDAWLLPERRHRLWVGLAGPYFELFLWSLATLTWRVTDPETVVHAAALIVMAVSGFNTLLNFNPFIKLDGYYILSDYLDMPNLRTRAFRYIGGFVKRIFNPEYAPESSPKPHERRLLLLYGLAATVTSFAFLAYAFVKMGGVVIKTHQPLAVALAGTALGIKFRRKVRKLMGKRPKSADADDGDDDGGDEANEAGPPKADPAQARRTRWLVGAAAVVGLVVLGSWELRIGGGFTVLPEENADVRAQTDGIIEYIGVREGDRVKAGDPIARLVNHATAAELEKTRASIKEAEAIFTKLNTGATKAEWDVVNAGLDRARNRLEFARSKVGRLEVMVEKDLVTRNEFEDAKSLSAVAENDLAEAQGRADLLKTRTRQEDLQGTRARLEFLRSQERFLAGEVEEFNVVSPASGIVATPERQLKEMERQMVTRGTLIAKVYEFGAVTAQIVVSEKEIADVQVGQKVVLRARAYPTVVFEGTVTAVATAADGSSVPAAAAAATRATASAGGTALPGQQFIVTTRIENPDLLLKPGMTGQAKIVGGQRRIGGLIARRLARTFNVEFWSWW